jgi:hypothetical protein
MESKQTVALLELAYLANHEPIDCAKNHAEEGVGS